MAVNVSCPITEAVGGDRESPTRFRLELRHDDFVGTELNGDVVSMQVQLSGLVAAPLNFHAFTLRHDQAAVGRLDHLAIP